MAIFPEFLEFQRCSLNSQSSRLPDLANLSIKSPCLLPAGQFVLSLTRTIYLASKKYELGPVRVNPPLQTDT